MPTFNVLRVNAHVSTNQYQGIPTDFLPIFHSENLQDTVAIQPANFGAPVEDALISGINKKYANRVLHDVGLCIAVFDLSQASEGKVRYGDGCLWYTGTFVSGNLDHH